MKSILLVVLLAGCLALPAQETKHEIVNSHGQAADTKPLDPAVPDVYALSGHLQRIVVLRFKFGTDLLAGLEKMIAQEKIRNAVILSGFGSVRGYQVHQVSNRSFPSHDLFVKDPTKPADIIGMSGMVMDGRVHPHITLANGDVAFGGHLEPGTQVFTFAVITLGVLDDSMDLKNLDNSSYR